MGVTFAAASTEYVSAANNLGIDGGALTFMLWAKASSEIGSGSQTLIVQENVSTDVGNYINYEYNGGTRRLTFNRIKEGVAVQAASYNVTLGTTDWYHIAMTYDTTNIRGYVNGAIVAGPTAASGNGAGSPVDLISIGASISAANPSDFTLGEARIWSTALTADQIATEMRSQQPVFMATLINYWPLNNAVLPATYTDFKGGVALTPTNTPTVGQSPPF